jgi:putative DNA primase/helicase
MSSVLLDLEKPEAWPTSIDNAGIIRVRDQLWAEAQAKYSAGVPWWIQSSEVEQVAREEQHARYVGDPWDLLISEHIATRSEVSIDEILTDVIKLERARWGQSEQNRVARCLRSQGFVRFQLRVGKKRAWRYRKEAPVTG